ncbi:MAG: PLP-dependent aminotransferase family protein [Chloroflexi bacterium]|nr:PLP-dependent aminotransferase family protein [Chloroflexota bacterium]
MAQALAITLDERGGLSLQQQLYTRLRDDILAGRLRPGERLPASRNLAGQLAVSRTTVVLVYDQLIAEGYAEARQGSGTYVSRQIPDDLIALPSGGGGRTARSHGTGYLGGVAAGARCDVQTDPAVRPFTPEASVSSPPASLCQSSPLPPSPSPGASGSPGASAPTSTASLPPLPASPRMSGPPVRAIYPPSRLSAWGNRLSEVHRAVWGADDRVGERFAPFPYDFRPGRPDWDTFPRLLWSRLAARQVRDRTESLASYGNPAGYRPLREAIAAHLSLSRGVRCHADHVAIVNGSQQGLDLLIRLWLDPGEIAALENPGYPGAALAFRANGVGVRACPIDEEGLDVAALPAPDAPDAPRLVYVTPSHQFPTGATLSLPRRLRLLEWAARRGALIVEDDYDSEFRYSGRPLESLQGLDPNGVVAYAGSFSKALFPPLRVGFVVLPPALQAPFVAGKWLADRQTATLDQQVLSDFIGEGHFERHLRRMRRLYQARRDVLLASLREQFGTSVVAGGDGAGLHLVAWLPDDWDAEALSEAATRYGVAAPPLAPYYLEGTGRPGLMLGFAALDEAHVAEGIRRLARAADDCAVWRVRAHHRQ